MEGFLDDIIKKQGKNLEIEEGVGTLEKKQGVRKEQKIQTGEPEKEQEEIKLEVPEQLILAKDPDEYKEFEKEQKKKYIGVDNPFAKSTWFWRGMVTEETPNILEKKEGKYEDPYSKKKNLRKKKGAYSEQDAEILDESYEIANLLK